MMQDTTPSLVHEVQLVHSPRWEQHSFRMLCWLRLDLSERRPLHGQ